MSNQLNSISIISFRTMFPRVGVSLGVILLSLLLLEIGSRHAWFGWDWEANPNRETIVLIAVCINLFQLALSFKKYLYCNFDITTEQLYTRLFVCSLYLLIILWPILIFEYIDGNLAEKMDAISGIFIFTMIPVTVYLMIIIGKIIAHLAGKLEQEKELSRKFYQMSLTDQLTGLPNRMLFFDRLKQELLLADRYNYAFAVMYIDLDRFKLINDSYGHDIGDELLRQAAAKLKGCLRECDTIARMGGDEFTILLPHLIKAEDVAKVARKIIESLSIPIMINGQKEVFIIPSIGISLYPTDGLTSESLLKKADIALYKVKAHGGNNFQFYSSSL